MSYAPLPDEWFNDDDYLDILPHNADVVPPLPEWWDQMPDPSPPSPPSVVDGTCREVGQAQYVDNAIDEAKKHFQLGLQLQAMCNRGGFYGYIWCMSEEKYEKTWKKPKADGSPRKSWEAIKKRTIWHRVDDQIDFDQINQLHPKDLSFNVYFGVNPTMRAGEPWQRAAKGATAKSPQVYSAACLYADFDAKDFDPDLKDAAKKYKEYMKQGRKMDPTTFSGALSPEKGKALIRQHIASLPIPPSATVDSGGGINAYWFFDEPFIFSEGDGGMARIERLQEAWVWVVGADKDAKDMTRVLRKPGTYNRKGCYDPTPRLVKVDNLECERLYPLVDLEAHVNEALPSVLTFGGVKSQGVKVGRKGPKDVGPKDVGLNIPDFIDLSGVAVGELKDVWGAPRTIVNALERLDMVRCDRYDSWIKVGLVLFNESDGADWGLTLFDYWSQKSTRYESGATAEVWKRFGDHKREGSARLMRGSLIKWAIDDSNSREWLKAKDPHAHLYRDGFDVHWPKQTGEIVVAKSGETQINVIPDGYKLGQCWSIRSLCVGTKEAPRRFGLIAPTGIGKTTLSMFDPYTVLYVPYRLLAISTWENYSDRYGKDDVALVIGNRAIRAKNPTRFIVLYDCADVLVNYLQEKHKDDGVDIFLKYVVYIDEAHQLVYAAIFRNRAVRAVIKNVRKFYNVFFMTATYLPATPGTEGAQIIRFESEVPHVRDLYIGAIGDVAKAVDQIIVHETGGRQACEVKCTITWYAKDETGSHLVQHQKRITEWQEKHLPQHTDEREAVIEKMRAPSYEVDRQKAWACVSHLTIDQAQDTLDKMINDLSGDVLIEVLGYVYRQDQYLSLFLEKYTPVLMNPDKHRTEYDEISEQVSKSWPDLLRTLGDISDERELLPLQQAGIPQDPDVIRELLDEWGGLPIMKGTSELPSWTATLWLNNQLEALEAKEDVKLSKITAFLTDAHERTIDQALKDLHYVYVKAMVLSERVEAYFHEAEVDELLDSFDALVNADRTFREVIRERERTRQQSLTTPAVVVFRNNKVMNQVTQKNLHEKGYNFMRFDSDVKHTDEFKKLTREQRLPESLDGLLVTGVYSDGHNVYANPKESLNFGPRPVRTAYVSGGRGAIGISTVDQSDERIRDHLGNVGTIIGMSFNKKPKPIYINDLEVTITGDMWTDIPIILDVLKNKADRGIETMQSLVDLAAKKGEKAYKDQHKAYLKTQLRHTGHRVVVKPNKNGQLVRVVEVDMLILRARAQEVFDGACWQSTELMIRALNGVSQSIYAFRGAFAMKTAFTEEEKDAFNAECKKIRDDTQSRELEALDELKLFTPKEVFDVAQDPDGDLDQKNAAIYLLACLGVDIEPFSAIDHIHAMAEQVQLTLHNVLERIVKPAAYTKLRNRGDAQPKLKELLGRFKVGDALTKEDLDELAFELEGQLFLKQELANTEEVLTALTGKPLLSQASNQVATEEKAILAKRNRTRRMLKQMYGAHTTPCKRFLQIETINPLPNLRFDVEDVFNYERSHDLVSELRTLAMWVPQEKLVALDEWVAPRRLAGFDEHFSDERKARLRWLRAVAKGKLENVGKVITRQDGPVKDLEIQDCHAAHIADLIEWCESGAKASEVVSERPMSDAEKKIYQVFRRHSKRGNKPLTARDVRVKTGKNVKSRLTTKQVEDALASLVDRGIVEVVKKAKQRKERYRLAALPSGAAQTNAPPQAPPS